MAVTGLAKLVEEACATFEAAQKTLEQSRDSNDAAEQSVPSGNLRTALSKAAEALKQEVAKCAFMASSADDEASAALLEALQQKYLHLFAVFAAVQVGKISSVRTEVQATGKKVAQAATAFARLAFLQKGSGGALNQAAGLVFERCDSAAKLQTENRAAVSSSLMKVLSGLKDAVRELEELKSGRGEGEDLLDGSEELSELHDFSTAELSPQEEEVEKAVEGVVKAAYRQLKALADRVLRLPADLGDEASQWNATSKPLQHIATSLNDLAAAVYPPQDQEELQQCLEDAKEDWRLLDEAVALPAAKEGSEMFDKAAGRIADASSALDGGRT